jgi:hypothetical protein
VVFLVEISSCNRTVVLVRASVEGAADIKEFAPLRTTAKAQNVKAHFGRLANVGNLLTNA